MFWIVSVLGVPVANVIDAANVDYLPTFTVELYAEKRAGFQREMPPLGTEIVVHATRPREGD